MTIFSKQEPWLLFLGDLFFFVLSLWLMLIVRYAGFPSSNLFLSHLYPFSFLFVVWILSFFIAGLYERHTTLLRNKLPSIIFNTQIINSIIAVLFFYFIPYFGITPKTNLFIYLFISFASIVLWRLYIYQSLGAKRKQVALLVGSGREMKELYEEVNFNSHSTLYFTSTIDLDTIEPISFEENIIKSLRQEDTSIVVIDLKNPKVEQLLPHFYNLIFSKIKFIDIYQIYEDAFKRVPLSLLKYNWFLENISTDTNFAYDALKRLMDVLISLPLGIISLLFYPFVYIGIKIEDGGSLFIVQERIGRDNKKIKIYKFRSMNKNVTDLNSEKNENKITSVGSFIRKTRIDEVPQLWSVIRGDMSLIGPRPELPSGVEHYEEQIPYYAVRHLIKPGLSGWAQIYHDNHPHHGIGVEETKEKLSYDLYYIKNRSFILDLKIALKTIKKLLSRAGV